MGVADNKTYRNEYHFANDYNDADRPSVEVEPKINSTIKENPYRSNVEIEGGEIVLKPDLSALFKASGKRHSKGGMDVLLEPDSFVFSDFNELNITEEEHKLFELKKGGTPANTLKKNVDVEHYNRLVNILEDPYKDDLAKSSATKMLAKYISTIGNIAYIQEQKKGFPQDVPEFAMNTAPIYDPQLKTEIEANKQYMKAGGTTGNPYMQKAGNFPPTKVPQKWQDIVDPITGLVRRIKIPKTVVSTGNATPGVSGLAPTGNATPGVSGVPEGTPQGIWNIPQFVPINPLNDPKVSTRQHPNLYEEPKKPVVNPEGPKVGEVNGDPQGAVKADWSFTPWQKLSQMYNASQYANVKKYMPYRSQYNATYVDPAMVSPEQTIGDMKSLANQQLAATQSLNPIMRNAQASATYGQLLQQMPGVRSQYDNQNAQILNQSRQFNNQVRNNESMVNMQNDQQYYQQAVEGNKNFDNMRQFTSNQYMNNVLRDVETNQKLSYNLLTQDNPAYNYDWKTGDFTRTNKSILDAKSADSKGDSLNTLLAEILKEKSSMTMKDRLDLLKIMTVKGFTPSQSSATDLLGKKKGGKVKRNPYK